MEKSDKRIVLEPGVDNKKLFLKLCKINGLSQKQMFMEMMEDHLGNYVRCPKCDEILFDRRTMTVTGPGVIVCNKCGYEFKENFE